VSASAVPLCPSCHSASAAWEIDSPVRALDRSVIGPDGLRLLGLVIPDEGFEPLDRPAIRCASCSAPAVAASLRDAVLVAANAATRGETPRFDA